VHLTQNACKANYIPNALRVTISFCFFKKKKMRKLTISLTIYLLTSGFNLYAQQVIATVHKKIITSGDKTLNSQGQGKRVAFLGDSMTDKRNVGTTYVYWEYLNELLGIEPLVYGINGHQWNGIYYQALKLHEEKGMNVDAILIFAGTND